MSICAALVDNPIAGEPASFSMITKGGLNAAMRSLAMEHAKEHIRFNAVAPGIVATSPYRQFDRVPGIVRQWATVSTVEDIASAVVYLTEGRHITGEVLHVDGGAHIGKW